MAYKEGPFQALLCVFYFPYSTKKALILAANIITIIDNRAIIESRRDMVTLSRECPPEGGRHGIDQIQGLENRYKDYLHFCLHYTLLRSRRAALFSSHDEGQVIDEKRATTRKVIDIAYTLVTEYDSRAQKGEFSVQEAQKRALARISSLRYQNNDYIWVNDMQPRC